MNAFAVLHIQHLCGLLSILSAVPTFENERERETQNKNSGLGLGVQFSKYKFIYVA